MAFVLKWRNPYKLIESLHLVRANFYAKLHLKKNHHTSWLLSALIMSRAM